MSPSLLSPEAGKAVDGAGVGTPAAPGPPEAAGRRASTPAISVAQPSGAAPGPGIMPAGSSSPQGAIAAATQEPAAGGASAGAAASKWTPYVIAPATQRMEIGAGPAFEADVEASAPPAGEAAAGQASAVAARPEAAAQPVVSAPSVARAPSAPSVARAPSAPSVARAPSAPSVARAPSAPSAEETPSAVADVASQETALEIRSKDLEDDEQKTGVELFGMNEVTSDTGVDIVPAPPPLYDLDGEDTGIDLKIPEKAAPQAVAPAIAPQAGAPATTPQPPAPALAPQPPVPASPTQPQAKAAPAVPAGKPPQRQKRPTAPPPIPAAANKSGPVVSPPTMPAGQSGPVASPPTMPAGKSGPAPRAAAPLAGSVVEAATDSRADETIPTSSPLFMHELGNLPAVPLQELAASVVRPAVAARPAAPAARPAAPEVVPAALPRSDETVPVGRQELPLPSSLPVLGDDGVDPSPEYIAAREAALRAVRASKQASSTPVPVLVQGRVVIPEQRPLAPAMPSDHMLERSYTDALAAIDDNDEAEVSNPGYGSSGSNPGAIPASWGSSPSIPMPSRGPAPARSGDPWRATSDPGIPAEEWETASNPRVSAADFYGDDDEVPKAARIVSPGTSAAWAPNPKKPRKIKRPSGPAPGFTGAKIERERNVIRMGMGGMLIGGGLFLLLFFLPGHAPLAMAAAEGLPYVWRFTPALYGKAQMAAAAFMGVGLLFVLNGAFFKPQSEIVCKRCKRYVIAQRDMVNMKCPRSSHLAGICLTTLVLIGLFIACVGAMLVLVAQANIIRGG